MSETPTPEPSIDPKALYDSLANFGTDLLIVGTIFSFTGLVIAFILLNLAKHEPKGLLPVAITFIVMMGLLLFAVKPDDGLLAITAAGIGALATALTDVFARHREGKEEDDD